MYVNHSWSNHWTSLRTHNQYSLLHLESCSPSKLVNGRLSQFPRIQDYANSILKLHSKMRNPLCWECLLNNFIRDKLPSLIKIVVLGSLQTSIKPSSWYWPLSQEGIALWYSRLFVFLTLSWFISSPQAFWLPRLKIQFHYIGNSNQVLNLLCLSCNAIVHHSHPNCLQNLNCLL